MQNKESLDYKKAKMESYQEQNRYTCLTSVYVVQVQQFNEPQIFLIFIY